MTLPEGELSHDICHFSLCFSRYLMQSERRYFIQNFKAHRNDKITS